MHSFVILAYKRKGVVRQNVQTNKKVMHIYAVKLQGPYDTVFFLELGSIHYHLPLLYAKKHAKCLSKLFL